MKLAKRLAFGTALALVLGGIAGCASDGQQAEDEIVQAEAQSQFEDQEFSEFDELAEDQSLLGEDASVEEAYGFEDESSEFAMGDEAPATDFTDAAFEETIDQPFAESEPASFQESEPAMLAESVEPSWDQNSAAASYSEPAFSSTGERFAYVVQAGDSLSKIAGRVYGDVSQWERLLSANSISNPNRIYPGDTIYVEATAETQQFAQAFNQVAKQTYTVQAGDNLASISQAVLGSSANWKVLWGYNQGAIENPNKIYVGQQLQYIGKQDMSQFLAQFDQAAVHGQPAGMSSPVYEQSEPEMYMPVSDEVSEEVIYEEVPVDEVVVGDEGDIIEDIMIDDDAVMDDEDVLEDN